VGCSLLLVHGRLCHSDNHSGVVEVSAASSTLPGAVQAAEALNSEPTLEGVGCAVRKLKLGRMAGPDGV
jgi:hypothetical protein